ncbi:MAG: hypothetical protein GY818_00065 [Planctomycetaceae bacterium]|nr:hypothetical protein [Planctomycetaceae bacterium]
MPVKLHGLVVFLCRLYPEEVDPPTFTWKVKIFLYECLLISVQIILRVMSSILGIVKFGIDLIIHWRIPVHRFRFRDFFFACAVIFTFRLRRTLIRELYNDNDELLPIM